MNRTVVTSPRPSPAMRARRPDDGFKTRIPRPSVRQTTSRDASRRARTAGGADITADIETSHPHRARERRRGVHAEASQEERVRELTVGAPPTSSARSRSTTTIAARAETTEEDDALEALLL